MVYIYIKEAAPPVDRINDGVASSSSCRIGGADAAAARGLLSRDKRLTPGFGNDELQLRCCCRCCNRVCGNLGVMNERGLGYKSI